MSNYHTFNNDEIAKDVIDNDTQLDQHEGLINNLQTQITNLNNDLVSNTTTLTNNINNNSNSIVSLNTSQQSQNDELATLTTAMTNQQTITTSHATTISNLQTQNTDNTNAINGLLGADTTIQANINTNTANINNLVSLTNGILSSSTGSLTIGGAIGGADNNLFIGETDDTTCGFGNKECIGNGGNHAMTQDKDGVIKINGATFTMTTNKNLDLLSDSIVMNSTNVSSVMNENILQSNQINGNATNISNNLTAITNNGNDITGIKNNSLNSVLKSAVDANSAKVGITNQQATDITNNNAKNTFPSSLNSLISRGTGYTLEVGSGIGVPRIRLRGQNGVATSSELIFIDATGNNPEYYQGATIRFNSSANRLEFGTDQGNDNSPEGAMFIYRTATPQVEIFRLIVPTTFDLMGIDQYPRQNFMYARRIKLIGSSNTPNTIACPNTQVGVIWNKVIINGALSYDNTTGILTTSATGLYKIKAKLCYTCSSAQRVAKIGLKSGPVPGGTDVIVGKNHLSRHESSNSSFSAPEIDGNVRLQSGINYMFWIECLNDGATIQNQQYENNDLCIEQLVLPNGYVLPTDYSPV